MNNRDKLVKCYELILEKIKTAREMLDARYPSNVVDCRTGVILALVTVGLGIVQLSQQRVLADTVAICAQTALEQTTLVGQLTEMRIATAALTASVAAIAAKLNMPNDIQTDQDGNAIGYWNSFFGT